MMTNKPSTSRLPTKFLPMSWAWGALFFSIMVYYLVKTPMNHDVAWLLYAGGRALDGAKLYIDIYETNPPLAVYFNYPALYLARVFGWPEIPVFYVYFLILMGLSIWLSRHLINLIFDNFSSLVREFIFLTLVFLVTVWPLNDFGFFPFNLFHLNDFGQREHAVFLLTMPYIWAAMMRSQGKPLTRWRALLIGSLAGIGFSFKPHFILVWFTVEGYLALRCRLPRSWRRPENIAIATVMFVYLLIVCIWESNYLALIPLIREVYFGYNSSWLRLIVHPTTLIWALAGITTLRLSDDETTTIWRLLFLAATAFLMAAFVQKKGWTYQLYPAMATSSLLLVGVAACQVERMEKQGNLTWLTLPSFVKGLLLAFTIIGITGAQGNYRVFQKGPLPELIPLVKKYARNEPIYVFSTDIPPSFPLVNYAGARWPYHFQCLWPLPGIYHQESSAGKPFKYHSPRNMSPIEKLMVRTVVADLAKTPPKLLIVDNNRYKSGLGIADFDLIAYFSQDRRFKELMSNYTLLTRCGAFIIYKSKDASAG
jgi:hypothetical protein